ncbi:unnamed protein product [Protopolystoma xenopodis]|uniref:Uncharacterized protein n=1 Tax=Protopolystoma xenopodis TaxID=117903 RepID=A0A448X403_9PLAT|nr:unnamed protein product [Protopolystoma xenopodis]
MLLSGGTFLYVSAAHILPELASENARSCSDSVALESAGMESTVVKVGSNTGSTSDVSALINSARRGPPGYREANCSSPTLSIDEVADSAQATRGPQDKSISGLGDPGSVHFHNGKGFRPSELFILLLGAAIPMLISLGHSH